MERRVAFGMAFIFMGLWALLVANAKGEEVERGRKLYENKCAICHGPGGQGNGPGAELLQPKPPDFTQAQFWERQNVDQLIAETIKNGHGPMPAFKLKADEIEAIIDFMTDTFKPSSK